MNYTTKPVFAWIGIILMLILIVSFLGCNEDAESSADQFESIIYDQPVNMDSMKDIMDGFPTSPGNDGPPVPAFYSSSITLKGENP